MKPCQFLVMGKNFAQVLIISLLALIFFSGAIFAQSANLPAQIPIQGKLSDSAGKSLTGNFNFKFEIYDSATAGAKLWEEEQKGIPVSKGKFQVFLGKVSPLTEALAIDKLLYVQVYVKTVDEPAYKSLSPRYALSPTFAKVPKSGTSDVANSVNVSKIIGKITDAMIEAVSASKLTGLLSVNTIPPLSADKIASGIFDAARIPLLDVGKITGQLSDSQIKDINARKVFGQVNDSQISDVWAGKISGQVTDSQIASGVSAAKITKDTLPSGVIPSIGDSKITDVAAGKVSGTFDVGKITGTFPLDRLPIAKGTASVSDGATINFGKTLSSPAVVCSSEDGYICAVTSITSQSFVVKLVDMDGVRPASPKSVNWQAIGS